MKKLLVLYTIIIIAIVICCNGKIYALSNNRTEITYEAHVENIGWQSHVLEGNEAGTTGKALRMEAIKIDNKNSDFKLIYKVHVQDIGWMDWKEQGQIAGTTGRALRMEAIQIQIENLTENQYSIKYRLHVENIGWQNWVYNGQIAGTTGMALRAEAIEIKIIEKDEENQNTITSIKKGIDVSRYQGTINWEKVKQNRN